MVFQSTFHQKNTQVTQLAENIEVPLLKKLIAKEWVHLECLPIQLKEKKLTVYCSSALKKQCLDRLQDIFNIEEIVEIHISPQDWVDLASLLLENELLDEAIYQHHRQSPVLSALTVFSKRQYLSLYIFLSLLSFFLYFSPYYFFTGLFFLCNLIFALGLAFRTWLCFASRQFNELQSTSNDLSDDQLPTYTILLPVYKESEVLNQLINAIDQLDYPNHKKDALLIIEQCDEQTQQALKNIKLPSYFRVIYLPKALPQTKPKACNYALHFAQGEYVVIYDAEDIPEKDQLKRALKANLELGEQGLCVQAALNFYNHKQNILTQLFTMEYSYLYDYMLPGLHSLKLPIPLGGTSNHFHTQRLLELGGWDPFNTTEDADLGMRAFIKGLKVGVIRSCTWEEANSQYGNWIRQRSRWIKGFFHTALVHNRQIYALIRKGQWKEMITFELLMAVFPLALLVSPLLWTFTLLSFVFPPIQFLFEQLPRSLIFLNYVNFLVLNILCIQMYMLGLFHRKKHQDIYLAILAPLYHLFYHSVAAVKALWQLFSNPFYWEKTTHGLFRQTKK